MKQTIGVDIGSYNSLAAVAFSKDQVIQIQSKNGRSFCEKNHPSFVQFDKTGKMVYVGGPAKNNAGINPELVVWGAKRLVGISYDEAREKGELDRFKYPISKDENGNILIPIGERTYRPKDILQFILEEIKSDAENPDINPMTGGASIDKIIITVPAYYKAFRTQPIVDAAKAAGFKDVNTLAEPTAAAIRYGVNIQKESMLLAFDIGAGTLDVSLVQLVKCGDKFEPAEIATSGNQAFGGIDIDSILLTQLTKQHKVASDPNSQSRFRMEVEKTKIRLSSATHSLLELPDLRTVDFTREQMEETLMQRDPATDRPYLLSKLRGPIESVFDVSDRSASEVDHVIFIGGPVNMPIIRRIVRDELERLGLRREVLEEIESLDQEFPADPMDAVAEGAALRAADIQKPVCTVLAEGYGTIQAGQYYSPITEPNSSYPICGHVSLHCPSVFKRLPISIIAKIPDTNKGSSFKYENLGQFSLAIRPTGQSPVICVDMTINEDKTLEVQLTHQQTDQKVTYRSLNLLVGKEINLKEGEVEVDESILKLLQGMPKSSMPAREWTQQELDRVINAAKSILAGYPGNNGTVAASNLRNAIATAVQKGNPSQNGPDVYNYAQTYLSELLSQNMIDTGTYMTMKTQLDIIVE
jgi:molecular chaperone DnaK (HSP70)